MNDTLTLGKTTDAWKQKFPAIEDICVLRETCWRNPQKKTFSKAFPQHPLSLVNVEDASRRLERFAASFMAAFPETVPTRGILESPLQAIPNMQKTLEREEEITLPGTLMIKLNSHLPIPGSIKARGGIYEVLKTAEDVAFQADMLKESDDYSILASPPSQELFSRYAICVGSVGNLRLSIGIISARLGFRATVHMSADTCQWKKDMLRSEGVVAMEHASDYSIAVERGRKSAEHDSYCHFVDDGNSKTLFLGYSAATSRLKNQLEQQKILVDQEHLLFVYLPCRVGDGPGGVAFGSKLVFGGAAHCFFTEPTHSCCMMLGMATKGSSRVNVQDFGIDNRTVADGLVVGRASSFVDGLMRPFMSGCYSLSDGRMYYMLAKLIDTKNLYLEPSALAGMYRPVQLVKTPAFRECLEIEHLLPAVSQGTQLVWATGDSMVLKEEMGRYYRKGASL